MVHVKYPSMERQDLTQAQLGSFKFTPVDEASRDAPHPHPLFLSQYAPIPKNGSWNSEQRFTTEMVCDASFFNHQIKPSLDGSRLRLGPAAVRAAVESASSSPQKYFSRRRPQDAMRGNVRQEDFHTSRSIQLTTHRHSRSFPISLVLLSMNLSLPCTQVKYRARK